MKPQPHHRPSRRRIRAQLAACGVTLALILLAVVINGSTSSAGARGARSPIATAALAEHFALLRAPEGVAPPAALARALSKAPASFDLSLAGARHASASNAWLVPGNGWLCIAAVNSEGLGLSCTAAASAERGELTLIERSTSTGEEHIVGACPDGYSTISAFGGNSARLASSAVGENTYRISARNAARMAVG